MGGTPALRSEPGKGNSPAGQVRHEGWAAKGRQLTLLTVHCPGQEGDRAVGRSSDERQIDQQKKRTKEKETRLPAVTAVRRVGGQSVWHSRSDCSGRARAVEEEGSAAHAHQRQMAPEEARSRLTLPRWRNPAASLCSELCLAEVSFSSASFPGALEARLPGRGGNVRSAVAQPRNPASGGRCPLFT